MNNYEEKCLALDKELAELLGWTDVGFFKATNEVKGIYNGVFDVHKRWTQDDAEAFRLMVEYQCFPKYENSWHSIMINNNYYELDSSNTKEAIRCAIVQAVINKLKG